MTCRFNCPPDHCIHPSSGCGDAGLREIITDELSVAAFRVAGAATILRRHASVEGSPEKQAAYERLWRALDIYHTALAKATAA